LTMAPSSTSCVSSFFYEIEFPAKLIEDTDKELAAKKQELEDIKAKQAAWIKQKDEMGPPIGKEAKKAADKLDMDIFDSREEVKVLSQQIVETEKEQTRRRNAMRSNKNTLFWKHLPDGYAEEMAADPKKADEELLKKDREEDKRLTKTLQILVQKQEEMVAV